uniref:Sodium/hydrogen exchanger n=1 Tax=Neolamprologus brichardi TaxID=32507 RepID=A0A3Q4HI70_NEOBR
MAASWGFTLFLCVLLMVCRGLSLAGEDPDQTLSSSGQVKTRNPQIDNAMSSNHGTTGEGGHAAEPITTLPIVSWKWHHVTTPYLVALWILVSWLCKLGESCKVLFLQGSHWQRCFFFCFFLPPEVIQAREGFFSSVSLFFSNATLWICTLLAVGVSYLLFGSLMAAVDPVAVIAVFEQVHVNDVLFIMVFGESLLNDGVTVVLFNVFDAFVSLGGPKIDAAEIVKGIVSFFVVAFGGSLVGLVFGLLISLLTRCTKNIQIIEPGFIFVLGYLSYLTAEMLSLSAILSIVFCGMCCQKYINANMDENSVQTVRYAMKVFANGSETIIFVFLGISAIDKVIWVWNTGFILLTLLFVFVYRFIGVFFLTWILNRYRLVPLEFVDQVIMSYGGLRGAVAYGLAVMLDENKIKEKNLMVCTTLIVVYFTVILQGITMKPLVMWLKVKRAAVTEVSLLEKLTNKTFNHALVAIEDISGQIGHNYMRSKWKYFEENWMSWILMKPSARKKQDQVFDVFHQLNLKDAMEYVTEGERRGSLEFVRNENSIIDFKKKSESESFDINNANMSNDLGAIRDPIPSVSLEMHEQTMKAVREAEAINAHHLLDQHLYKSRKQHRHRFSRSHFDINRDEKEVQEIFQRTMRNRLKSFTSAKMGVKPPKTIVKHTQKEQQQKPMKILSCSFLDSEGDSASGYDQSYMRATYRAGAGIENPAFMPDLDPMELLQIPPWLAESELDSSMVALSHRAQVDLPRTPSNLRRLASLRISTRSTDSFTLENIPDTQQMDSDQLQPPPPPPPRDDGYV